MSNAKFRLVIVLGVCSTLLIILSQYIWLAKAFNVKEKNFNQAVNIALRSVAFKLAEYNQNPLPVNNPVNRLSNDYYVVNFNDQVDAVVLEYLLKSELERHQLHLDFEYGIYDCASDRMVYGNYINMDSSYSMKPEEASLLKWENYEYYFGVHFPTKTFFIGNQLTLWALSSVLLFVVIIFFTYTVFIVLKQKRLSEVQKDFINNMTHEFKTPLSTISIAADVLNQQPNNGSVEDRRIKNYVNIIKSQSKRLNDQVEKVLQMIVLERKEQKFSIEVINLKEVMEEIVINLSAKAQEKGGCITLRYNTAVTDIKADRLHFSNIVYNLVDNALKYCDKTPQIAIEVEKTRGGTLEVSVKDNGIGISQKDLKRIFDKFYRVPTGNLHNVKGFGIGLNYVKEVVKAHHWKITAESELGEGSTFTIFIT